MKGRVLVTVLSAIALLGCRTSIHIPPAQAPCVEGGKVRDLRGIEETVREKREVILHPPAGAVFMRAPHSGLAIPVPAYDEPLLAARGLRLATPVGRSLDVSSGGVLSLTGPDGTWTVPAASVGLACALWLVGCAASPNPVVLTRAPRNPLSGATALRVMPVEDGPVSLDVADFAAPADERRLRRPTSEKVSPLSEPFEKALLEQTTLHGIRIVHDRDEKDAPFLVLAARDVGRGARTGRTPSSSCACA